MVSSTPGSLMASDPKKIVIAKQLKTLNPIIPQEEVVLFAAKAEIAS